ncbi:MAG: hypothetical protein Q8R02_17265 [Hyphomonadaceae bacterium]|nr:hypothetical protein [Hyphomonadaceae bacterium]
MPASTVIPQLPYAAVVPASDWLHGAFGFTVRLRIGDHRIQMNVGDGAVVLTQQGEQPSRCSVMVRVVDVDAHHAKAAAFGAQIASAPQSFPYGERQYTAIDRGGHVWTFSQSVADVAPEDWGGTSGRL